MLKVLTMTAYRRPEYTCEVLAALGRCEGIADWVLMPQIEPGCDETVAAFDGWGWCEIQPIINRSRLGLNRNTQHALGRAFRAKAEMVVHVEDDTVPSPDALRFFEWAIGDVMIPNRLSWDRHQILLASGYNKPRIQPLESESHQARTRPIWTPWLWGVDSSRLAWLMANWCTANPKCFTCKFKAGYRQTRREIYPTLSRCQNIGYEKGENGRTPDWYRANHRAPFVAGELPRKEWNLAAK